MITFPEACRIAQEAAIAEDQGDKYIEIVEISDRWFFAFLSYDPQEEPERLCTPFWVHKQDGAVEWISIPTYEQWKELQNGIRLKFIPEQDRQA